MISVVADVGAEDAKALIYWNQRRSDYLKVRLDIHINGHDCAKNRDQPLVLDGPILWIRWIVGAIPCYHIFIERGFR